MPEECSRWETASSYACRRPKHVRTQVRLTGKRVSSAQPAFTARGSDVCVKSNPNLHDETMCSPRVYRRVSSLQTLRLISAKLFWSFAGKQSFVDNTLYAHCAD
eukprot:2825633-Pleurochrysis_carterae.AAC.1